MTNPDARAERLKMIEEIESLWEKSGSGADSDEAHFLISLSHHLPELLKLARAGLMAEEILARVAKYGPPQGVKEDGIACAFCDMGGAGYASRGDGFHDDDCAVKDAQLHLAAFDRATQGGG